MTKTYFSYMKKYVKGWCDSHLWLEFQRPQALQSEHELTLLVHTTLSFQDPLQAQVGRTQNLQPDWKTCRDNVKAWKEKLALEEEDEIRAN